MNALTSAKHKKYLGYALGALMAMALALPALLIGADVHAQPLTGEDLYGGAASDEFAGEAGLGSGDLPTTIAAIIRAALGFLGIIAVVIILYGGFKWMTAGGNTDKVDEAKKIIIQGVIGLVIVLSAFAIASFVITQITGAVGEASP
jgi:hypothetical protein